MAHIAPPHILSAPSTRKSNKSTIPDDILLKIIPLLAVSDLIKFTRVSKKVHHLTIPTLYFSLYHDLTIDLTKSTRQIIHCSPRPSVWMDIMVSSAHSFVAISPFLHPFTYTKFLTLTSHDRRECSHHLPLHMPSLETLRVKPGSAEEHLELCYLHSQTNISYSSTTSLAPLKRGACCPIITQLRFRRLIIGGINTDLYGSGRGLWNKFSTFPNFVSELTVLVGMFGSAERKGREVRWDLLDRMPKNLGKVTFIMSTGEPGWDLLQGEGMDLGRYEVIWENCHIKPLMEKLIRLCSRVGSTIEFVGLNKRLDVHEDDHWNALYPFKDFTSAMLVILQRECRSEEVRAARALAGPPQYLEEVEFEKREGWYKASEGELIREDIIRWCEKRLKMA